MACGLYVSVKEATLPPQHIIFIPNHAAAKSTNVFAVIPSLCYRTFSFPRAALRCRSSLSLLPPFLLLVRWTAPPLHVAACVASSSARRSGGQARLWLPHLWCGQPPYLRCHCLLTFYPGGWRPEVSESWWSFSPSLS